MSCTTCSTTCDWGEQGKQGEQGEQGKQKEQPSDGLFQGDIMNQAACYNCGRIYNRGRYNPNTPTCNSSPILSSPGTLKPTTSSTCISSSLNFS